MRHVKFMKPTKGQLEAFNSLSLSEKCCDKGTKEKNGSKMEQSSIPAPSKPWGQPQNSIKR